MLVLSRKLQEKILLPTIGTAIHVLEIKRGVVRLGFEAPPEVTILREEVPDRATEWGPGATSTKDRGAAQEKSATFARRLLEHLKNTSAGLGLLGLQLEMGTLADARATFAELQAAFQLLLHGVAGEMEAPAVPPPSKMRTRRKALLVEDDSNQRELLAGFLRLSGLDVDTAGDGSDALDYLGSQGKPDVVLLDMGLPRVDGPTTVREIRRNPAFAGLKIFGVTGHLPEEFDLERGPRGIDGWFQKPLDPTVLFQELTKELDTSLSGF